MRGSPTYKEEAILFANLRLFGSDESLLIVWERWRAVFLRRPWEDVKLLFYELFLELKSKCIKLLGWFDWATVRTEVLVYLVFIAAKAPLLGLFEAERPIFVIPWRDLI